MVPGVFWVGFLFPRGKRANALGRVSLSSSLSLFLSLLLLLFILTFLRKTFTLNWIFSCGYQYSERQLPPFILKWHYHLFLLEFLYTLPHLIRVNLKLITEGLVPFEIFHILKKENYNQKFMFKNNFKYSN